MPLREITVKAKHSPLIAKVGGSQPKLATVLESGRATFVFDAAFLAKLESRFVSVNPIFPAEHQGPTYTFPITLGGQIAPNGSEGTLRTGGTVELLQRRAPVCLTNGSLIFLQSCRQSAYNLCR